MKLYPIELRRTGPSRYSMKLDATAPDGRYEFEFSVTGTDIRVVEAPAEFEILIRRNAGDVKPLLAAILAFDAAQQVEILS